MASFNKVILMGNLTRDPQVRYLPSGQAVAEVGLAVNRSWFDKQANQRKEEVTFVDVTLWGRTAEVAGEYLTKGAGVLIEGRLQLDQWDDKESGQKRSKLKVVGEQMTMLPRAGGSGGGGGGFQRSAAPAPAQEFGGGESAPAPAQAGGFEPPQGGGSPPDDNVPF
jgi:single-strand DNA-binding protein